MEEYQGLLILAAAGTSIPLLFLFLAYSLTRQPKLCSCKKKCKMRKDGECKEVHNSYGWYL